MSPAGWDKRFQDSTRGRIVGLLRRGPRSVDELASATALTDNAVRVHLAGLERDGLVRQAGVRRSGTAGKPASLYELAPTAEPMFSRAYVPTLQALVGALGEQLEPDELEAVMHETGTRIAQSLPAPEGDLDARVARAAALLEQLGGVLAPPENEGNAIVIRGLGCPLGAVTAHAPAACHALESLVSTLVGAPVTERCERGDRPRCTFIVDRGRGGVASPHRDLELEITDADATGG